MQPQPTNTVSLLIGLASDVLVCVCVTALCIAGKAPSDAVLALLTLTASGHAFRRAMGGGPPPGSGGGAGGAGSGTGGTSPNVGGVGGSSPSALSVIASTGLGILAVVAARVLLGLGHRSA